MSHFPVQMKAVREAYDIAREELRRTRLHVLRAGAVLAVCLVALVAGLHLAGAGAWSAKQQTTATFADGPRRESIRDTYSHLDQPDVRRPVAGAVGYGKRAAAEPETRASHPEMSRPHPALAAFTLVRLLMAEGLKRREASLGQQPSGTEGKPIPIKIKAKPERHTQL